MRCAFGLALSFLVVCLADAETVRLTGRETEAIAVATRDFAAKHYSRSGDLRHYTIELERQGKSVEIDFLADEPHPLRQTEAGTGSGTSYGLHVSYIVSLDPPKILKFWFSR